MDDETTGDEPTRHGGSLLEILRLVAALDQFAGALTGLQGQIIRYHGLLTRTSDGSLPVKNGPEIEALDARIAALVRQVGEP